MDNSEPRRDYKRKTKGHREVDTYPFFEGFFFNCWKVQGLEIWICFRKKRTSIYRELGFDILDL